MLAISDNSSANLLRTSSPILTLLSSLPLNRTVNFTLFPDSKNPLAFLHLKEKSWSPIFGVTLIYFVSTAFWFFLDSFSFLACSNLYFP